MNSNSPQARNRGRPSAIRQRQIALRRKLWPDVQSSQLWNRTEHDGFVTVPRAMPIILEIMDDLSNGRPVSRVYMDLWCRSFDECFLTLTKAREMAFHSGFASQRGQSTWSQRIRLLSELGFIDVKPGPSGELSYVLIFNPYLVIHDHYTKKTPGLTEAKYHALIERMLEIGAKDLDETPSDNASTKPAATDLAGVLAVMGDIIVE